MQRKQTTRKKFKIHSDGYNVATQIFIAGSEPQPEEFKARIVEIFKPADFKGWGHMDEQQRIERVLAEKGISWSGNVADILMRPFQNDQWLIFVK